MSRGCGRIPLATAVLVVALAALLVSGCGSSGALSVQQLRRRATQICDNGRRRTDQIALPTAPTQGTRFIIQGIAALDPPLTRLRRLGAPVEMAGDYRNAIGAFTSELTALRSTLDGLHAGNDPVVAIKTLAQQLAPAEARAAGAWRALGVPACASLTA